MSAPPSMNYGGQFPTLGDGLEIQHKKTGPFDGPSKQSSNTSSEFRISGNQINQFMDGKSLYFKGNFKGTATNVVSLTKYGVLSAIERIEAEPLGGGQKFCDISKYHVLKRIKAIQHADRAFRGAEGVILHGTSADTDTLETDHADGTAAANTVLSKGNGDVYIIPLDWLGLDKMMPLMGEGIKIVIHWASAFEYVTEATSATLAETGVTISNMSINYDKIRVSDAAFNTIVKNTGGILNMTTTTYKRAGLAIAGVEAQDLQLGGGKTKTKKIYACFRTGASTAQGFAALDRLSLDLSLLKSSYLELNDSKLNDKTLSFDSDNIAEALLMLRKSTDMTTSSMRSSNIDLTTFTTDVTPSTAQAPGTFFWSFDLTDGTDTDRSSSGINTKGANKFNLFIEASGAVTGTLDCFIEYENTITMNVTGDKLFNITD
jgi:hypothetical protein